MVGFNNTHLQLRRIEGWREGAREGEMEGRVVTRVDRVREDQLKYFIFVLIQPNNFVFSLPNLYTKC